MSTELNYEEELSYQVSRRKGAVELIKNISDLWYDKSTELILFKNQLVDKNVNEILNLLEYATRFVEKSICIFDALEISKSILKLDIPPSKLDVGRLAFEYQEDDSKEKDIDLFIANKLKDAKSASDIMSKDVVLYGFGRIGRLVARELMTKAGKGKQMRLRAIVTRGELTPVILEKRAALLRNDSIHGDFTGVVQINFEAKALIINGTTVHMIQAQKPEEIDYTKYDINEALVIDNTGAFRDDKALQRHLNCNGIDKVLLTAPGNGIPNIVFGVNHKDHDPDKVSIFSAASCTTNAIAPVLKVIEDTFGLENGHLETIHAYTNDQNLVDNMHKKYRRGRAAALNMVITETGAGKAVSKTIPSLKGKLTSNAIRVPVPNGSLAILKLRLEKNASVAEVNAVMKKYALEGELVSQIKYAMSDELVSSDIVGSSSPSIFDSKATIATEDGKNIVIYAWYDNEYGYSHQVIRLAKYISKVERFIYY